MIDRILIENKGGHISVYGMSFVLFFLFLEFGGYLKNNC